MVKNIAGTITLFNFTSLSSTIKKNNTIRSLSFGALSQPYTQCDKVKCHVTWSNPKELQLEPCTNYNIRVGPYNNVTIITLPGMKIHYLQKGKF